LLLAAPAFAALTPLKATTCPKYSCGASNDFQENQCIESSQSSNSYLVQPCSGNSTCSETVGFTDAYCQSLVPSGPCIGCVNAGDPCAQDSWCIGGKTCNNFFCGGQSVGSACSNDAYCLPGSFCNLTTAVCQQQYSTGSSGCLSDYSCNNQAGCNTTAGLTGNCVAYFSVPNGAVVQNCDCTSSYSMLCSSLTCRCYDDNSTVGVCEPAYKNSDISKPCTLGSTCSGVNSEGSILKTDCVCGNNDKGEAYCSPLMGDKAALDLYNVLKEHYSNPNITYCNTKSRAQPSCYAEVHGMEWAEKFQMYYYYYQNYPILQANDKCIQQVYNEYYWDLYYQFNPVDPDDHDDDDDSAWALFGVSLAIFI